MATPPLTAPRPLWRRPTSVYPVPAWVIASAGLAPLAVTVGWLVAGALQPHAYSPRRQTVSVMAGYGGTDRWVMTAALFLVAGCYLMMTVGMRPLPWRARLGLFVAGAAGIGIGVFPQPAHGSAGPHMLFTAIGEVALATWPGLLSFGPGGMPMFNRRTSVIVSLAFLLMLIWLMIELRSGEYLGAAERFACSVQTCGPFAAAWALRRQLARSG